MRLQVLNASDQDATGDVVMKDAAGESEMQEISTGGALADPMQQVCLLLLLRVSHCPHFEWSISGTKKMYQVLISWY